MKQPQDWFGENNIPSKVRDVIFPKPVNRNTHAKPKTDNNNNKSGEHYGPTPSSVYAIHLGMWYVVCGM